MLDPPAEDWVTETCPPASFNPAPTLIFSPCEPLGYHRRVPGEARYEVNKPDVVDESVDGEVLIVHLGTGAYYSARGTGNLVWQMVASGATCEAAASALGNGAGPALPAIERFVTELVEEGLIRPRSIPPREAPAVSTPVTFTEPVLEKFTDMQDLLLLDPIHDVEDEGWPNAKPAAGA